MEYFFFFCHYVCTRCFLDTHRALGVPAAEAADLVLVDGRRGPDLRPGRPILAPYVDNFNVLAWGQSDLGIVLGAVCRWLDDAKLAYRTECPGSVVSDLVGLIVDMEQLFVTNKYDRMWRVRQAVLDVCAQGRCSGYVMQILAGHLINLGLVFRPFLSILSSVFTFIVKHGSASGKLDVFVVGELNVVAALLPVLGCSLERRFSQRCYMSDSSEKGYAVHVGDFDCGLGADVASVRERWRLKDERISVQHAVAARPILGLQPARAAAERNAFDLWADDQRCLAVTPAPDAGAVLADPLAVSHDGVAPLVACRDEIS